MIKLGSFRELKHYSCYDIISILNISIDLGKEIISHLKRRNIIKVKNDSTDENSEHLQLEELAIGDIDISDSDKRYVFDYVGIIEFTIDKTNFIITCYPKYIKCKEEEFSLNDIRPFLQAIELYNKSQPSSILVSTESDDRIQYNPLAIVIFLLRDYWEHGIYTNSKDDLEKNGMGEIEWENTINQNVPFLKDGRPYYIDYYTSLSTVDESSFITELHKILLTKYSRHLKKTQLDKLFDIETVELCDGELSDFGNQDYIEQRLLNEINVQFVTHKQIILRAMYALIRKTSNANESSNISLFGTNSFYQVWEKAIVEVFTSQREEQVKKLPIPLCDKYKNENKTLLELIPLPKWKNYNPDKVSTANKTLIPDYLSVCKLNEKLSFIIMDAKYYDISLYPKLSGQPGVGDINKQYLYQLAYQDFIVSNNLTPLNMFLCPSEKDESKVIGEVEMPIFSSLNLENIKVVSLSAKKLLNAYISNKKIKVEDEISNWME